MKTAFLAYVVRCAVVVLALVGIAICVFWYPFSISLTTIGPVNARPTPSENIEMYTQLIFYWAMSIPCFVILFFLWKLSCSIKKGSVFTISTVKILRTSAIILFIDLFLFVVGNVIFMLWDWNAFAIVYFIIAGIGFVVACLCAVTAHYVSQATVLREEIDGTI